MSFRMLCASVALLLGLVAAGLMVHPQVGRWLAAGAAVLVTVWLTREIRRSVSDSADAGVAGDA